MPTTDDVSIRIRLRDALPFRKDAKQAANAIDDIGDEASQAARKIQRLNAATSGTRVSLGPFTTGMRGGALAVGAAVLGVEKFTPAVLSAAEATATMAGGAGAAGGVGLLALAQGAGVAKLGLSDLTAALGGNKEAMGNLAPRYWFLFDTLTEKTDKLRKHAGRAIMPGLEKGVNSALKSFPELNRVVGDTSNVLGGITADAGKLVGSRAFGRDLFKIGESNTRVIWNLGHAGIYLADSFRHVAVEAGPLTRWLSKATMEGARSADVWALNARNSGEMAHFFREARHDLSLLASAGGHTGRGLISLFGANDVDGTRTLRSLDRVTGRFEHWTNSPAVRRNVGDAIVAEIPQAVATVMDAVAETMPKAAGRAVGVFWHTFTSADVGGKLLGGAWLASKLGVGKLGRNLAADLLGRRGGPLAALTRSRGMTPVNPLFVAVVNPGGLPGGKGPPSPITTGGKGPWWSRVPLGAAAGGAAAGASVVGGALFATDLLDQLINGPHMTPDQARASQRKAVQDLGLAPKVQHLDAQGFPTPGTPTTRDYKAQLPRPTAIPIQLDGRELGRGSIRWSERRQARRK